MATSNLNMVRVSSNYYTYVHTAISNFYLTSPIMTKLFYVQWNPCMMVRQKGH